MPGGAGKPVRSCKLCKPFKFDGNRGGPYGRRTASELRRAPGVSRSDRRLEAERILAKEY